SGGRWLRAAGPRAKTGGWTAGPAEEARGSWRARAEPRRRRARRGGVQPRGESLEPLGALGEVVGRRDVDQVVDAAVLLHDEDVVLHGHAVELRAEQRVEGLAPVE